MLDLECLLQAIAQRRREIPAHRALLVGISGIDGSGKGFVTAQAARALSHVVAGGGDPGGSISGCADARRPETPQHPRPAGLNAASYNVAVIGADGWLNLPQARFAKENGAEHFYHHAVRFDEMFESLILPLRDYREVDIEMDFTEETATAHRRQRYKFREIDIVLLEGIFLFKREYRPLFDLACWIECSFETALGRAVRRRQEGLPPLETIRAFEEIYFPAQRIHLHRDHPRKTADLVLPNDDGGAAPRADFVTSILLPKP